MNPTFDAEATFASSHRDLVGSKAWTTALFSGSAPAAAAPSPLALLNDDIANDRSTAATLTVDGAHVVSTLNTLGDFDFFKVQLVAGQTYEFGVLAAVGGPSGVPLADAFVQLFDANGVLLGESDGGAST